MAIVENKPPVIQMITPGELTLVLTQEEAEGIRALFGQGLSVGVIDALNLRSLSDSLRAIEWLKPADVTFENAPLTVPYVSIWD